MDRRRPRPPTRGPVPRRQRPVRRRRGIPSLVKVVIAVIVGAFVLAIWGTVGLYVVYARGLPSLDNLNTLRFETTKIYDRNQVLLFEIFDRDAGRRTRVSLEEVPRYLTQATVATEDATFFENSGVDPRAFARAVVIEATGRGSSGASTITMQLVRNVLLQHEKYDRTLERKLREVVLATELTRRYSKEQILEMYLNEVYYGNLAYGIEAAANAYFGVQARDLTLAQAAMLAGLPQAPTLYDPTQNPQLAKERQRIVLGLMAKQGYITEPQRAAAEAEPLTYRDARQTDIKAPHFVYYVKQLLEQQYGPELVNRGGLSVFTTLDLRYQNLAEQVARKQVAALKDKNVSNAALVAMKPGTGEILAMLGSVDYGNREIEGQVNVATSPRQPGSSFKPIVYAAAFTKGYTPATMLADVPTSFGGYTPKNYDGRFRGPVLAREALAQSLNIPAVKMQQLAGTQASLDLAHALGITDLQRGQDFYGLSLTLGGGDVKLLDMTGAYTTFANGGGRVPPLAILRVVDTDGRVIQETKPNDVQPQTVLTPQVSYLVSSILSDNTARTPAFGPNSALKLSRPAAVKTGTTDDYVDNWTVGYTPGLVTGVWVGNNRPSAMKNVSGVDGAAPIWHDFMEGVFAREDLEKDLLTPAGAPPRDFRRPAGVVEARVDAYSGLLATASSPASKLEVFAEGTQPTKPDNMHQKLRVCATGGIAPAECDRETEEKVFWVLGDEFKNWLPGSGKAEEWLPPPTTTCDCTPSTPTPLATVAPLATVTPLPGGPPKPSPSPGANLTPGASPTPRPIGQPKASPAASPTVGATPVPTKAAASATPPAKPKAAD